MGDNGFHNTSHVNGSQSRSIKFLDGRGRRWRVVRMGKGAQVIEKVHDQLSKTICRRRS